MLYVDGQRGLPSRFIRLLLLNIVGSSPAARANPEHDKFITAANIDIVSQISL
jgi:hypothetical protein